MKTTACILATLLASASAFAPSASSSSSATATSLNADFSKEVGAQAPLGFFDPVGLLDGATDAQFYRLREQEVRHGRVAMVRFVFLLLQMFCFVCVIYAMFLFSLGGKERRERKGRKQSRRRVVEKRSKKFECMEGDCKPNGQKRRKR